MTVRKSISKKIRFEVFKRDKFTCQYCGKSAPEVILEVDHIQPISKDGDDEITNYITACWDCNRGKGARELSDDAVIQKRKAQLDALQERREQLEMMFDWQEGLLVLENETIEEVEKYWNNFVIDYSFNEHGRKIISTILQKFGLTSTLEAIKISTSQYIKCEYGDEKYKESVIKAFDYIGRIARARTQEPYMRDLYYIRGIMRKRYSYVNEWECLKLLKQAYKSGSEIEELKSIVLENRNWTEWNKTMLSIIGEDNNG